MNLADSSEIHRAWLTSFLALTYEEGSATKDRVTRFTATVSSNLSAARFRNALRNGQETVAP